MNKYEVLYLTKDGEKKVILNHFNMSSAVFFIASKEECLKVLDINKV